MKKLLFLFLISILFAQENLQDSNTTIQCNAIFNARKDEILQQIKELEEKKQSLEILQKASNELFAERENKLKEQEKKLEKKLQEIEQRQKTAQQEQQSSEQRVQNILTKNEEVLRQIQEEVENKIAQTYAKMKDSKAAAILNDLQASQAAKILFYLKPSEIGKILAKMDPKKAALLTQIIKDGPPFESNSTQRQNQPDEKNKPLI